MYFYIFSRATLNETFTAKYTPKRDVEYPHPFHMRSSPPPQVHSDTVLQKLFILIMF